MYKNHTIRFLGKKVVICKGDYAIHAFVRDNSVNSIVDIDKAKRWINDQERDQALPVEPETRGRSKLFKK